MTNHVHMIVDPGDNPDYLALLMKILACLVTSSCPDKSLLDCSIMTNRYPQIIHHGGRHQVTGSCHELVVDNNNSILIDCGLTQGEGRRDPEIDFPIDISFPIVMSCFTSCIFLFLGIKAPPFYKNPLSTSTRIKH